MKNLFFLLSPPPALAVHQSRGMLVTLLLSAMMFSLQAQTVCDDIMVRVSAPIQIDCYTVKIPVFFGGGNNFDACDMFVEGNVTGANATIDRVEYHPSFSSSFVNLSSFSIEGPSSSTTYLSNVSAPPIFEIYVTTDPGESFTLEFDEISFDLDANCSGTPCMLDVEIASGHPDVSYDINSPVMSGPTSAACDISASRDIDIFLDYSSPIAATPGELVEIPIKVRDNDNPTAAMLKLERLDLEIAYTDVYGGLAFEIVEPLTTLSNTSFNFGEDLNTVRVNLSPTIGNSFTIPLDGTSGEGQFGILEVQLQEEPFADGEAIFAFEYARFKEYDAGGAGACCSPSTQGDGTVTFDADEGFPCQDNDPEVLISIQEPTALENGDLSFPIFLEAATGVQDIVSLTELLVELELDADGGLTIDSDTENTVDPNYCLSTSCSALGGEYPQNGDCIEVRAGGTEVSFAFCTGPTTAGYPVRLFNLIVSGGSCGCVNDIRIKRARWDFPETTNSKCVLSIDKSIFDNNQTFCAPSHQIEIGCTSTVPVPGKVNLCQLSPSSPEYDCTSSPPCNDEVPSYDFGWFTSPACSTSGDYQLAACKNDFLRCGVSTFDIFLITRHILGLAPISDPKTLIAADVNGSGSISVTDQIAIRKVILGIETQFNPNVPAWRFITCGYSFTNPSSPWSQLPDASVFDYVAPSLDEPCFEAIKMGDVNCFNLLNCGDEEVDGEMVLFLGEETTGLNPGETRVYLEPDSFRNVAAFQFALQFDGTKFDYDTLAPRDLAYSDGDNIGQSEGGNSLLRYAWYDESGYSKTLLAGDDVIALSFDKLVSGSADLSGFSLDTAALQPIAYMADGTKQKITLSIRSGGKLGNGFLQQSDNTPLEESNEQKSALGAQVLVAPNPFSQKLLIDLGSTPSGAQASVTIFNSIGQQVWQWQGLTVGVLESSTASWPDGVYYYQVKIGEDMTSGKVIKGQ